jgi:prepilin-type N-terminal cleavage/methylation domain-containing protein
MPANTEGVDDIDRESDDRMKRFRSLQSGFTLIELMIVVVIIGVLSVLAVTGYRRYTFAARNAEADSFLLAVKGAQQSYYQAFGQYCGTRSADSATWPDEIPFEMKANWEAPPAANGWSDLGIKSPGRVWFQYIILAGRGNAPVPLNAIIEGNTDWFIGRAHGNFDGEGTVSTFEITSERNDVWRNNENH